LVNGDLGGFLNEESESSQRATLIIQEEEATEMSEVRLQAAPWEQ